MGALIFILIVGVLAAGLMAGSIYTLYLSKKQAKIDVQRTLEMVPLLIHLPPISDDTAIGGRDARDVVDETISKAQILYNIIASTAEKDRSSKLFGQRHFTFEIIGLQGFVYFYSAVPMHLVDVVKQAIVSAYPSASLEQTDEPNIFSQAGGSAAVAGGELVLKKPFAFPIATYQELKRDALQSVLGALTDLDKNDGVGIQILFRPASDGWRKSATTIAGQKRKGDYNDKKGLDSIGPFIRQAFGALSKPPEGKKNEESSPSQDISSLDKSVVDAIEDKTRHPGFEVAIRLIVSTNVSQRSQAILQNLVASFSLFDAPNKNGFKFEPTRDTQFLINEYILRSFHKRHKKTVLNSVELATLFHFPDQNNLPTSQVTRQESKQVDGPRNVPEQGLLLGYNLFRGAKKPIRLALEDRQRHMYVVGQTGTGKSTFLENLALQDMINGDGFAFVDPHGDTAEKLMSMVPKERTEDIVYFSPAEMDFPMGLNLFEYSESDQKDFLIQETLNMLQKLYDPQHQGIMGPRYEHIFRNAALAIMADPNGGTFVDVPKLFRDPDFLKRKLSYVKDQSVLDFWQKEYPASQRSNDAGEITAWFVSKFGAFLSNEMMRNIIGQTKSAFDLRDVMDNKKILLVNLSKGRTGDLNSKLLGMIFVMKFQAAAMSRASIPEKDRMDFSLYVDEFQNFSTDSFATIMSEARKYHLNLIVANQFTTQLTEEIRDAVFGNMGTIVSFRIGQNDVESLSKYFQPTFTGDDLLRVPNHNTITRTLIGGVPTQPFSMATLPPLGNPNEHLASALKQLSAAKYGRPRASVEAEIFERMKSVAPPSPPAARPYQPPAAVGQQPSPWAQHARPPQNTAAPVTTHLAQTAPKPNPPTASFLDDWLQKRQQSTVMKPEPPNPKPRSHQQPGQKSPAPASPATKATHLLKRTKKPHHTEEEHHELVIQPPKHDEKKLDLRNISSEQLDQLEIGEIAKELKNDLKTKPSSKPSSSRPIEEKPKPETPHPLPGPKPTAPVVEEVELPKPSDTIIPTQVPQDPKTLEPTPFHKQQPKEINDSNTTSKLPELKLGPKPTDSRLSSEEPSDTISIDEHGNLTQHDNEG